MMKGKLREFLSTLNNAMFVNVNPNIIYFMGK